MDAELLAAVTGARENSSRKSLDESTKVLVAVALSAPLLGPTWEQRATL